MLGILLLVVVLAGIYWLTQLKDRAVDSAIGAVNRRVRRGTHEEGVSFSSQQYFFAIDRSDDVVVEALRTASSRTQAPLVVPAETYLVDVGATRAEWAHGTRAQTLFRATAQIVTANDTERGVVLVFHDVTTSEGLVTGVGAMKALRRRVLTALRTVDGTVEGTVLQWG